jgi:hypothetical protein
MYFCKRFAESTLYFILISSNFEAIKFCFMFTVVFTLSFWRDPSQKYRVYAYHCTYIHKTNKFIKNCRSTQTKCSRRGHKQAISWLLSFSVKTSIYRAALYGVSGQRHVPAALYPRERNPGTYSTGVWVGRRAAVQSPVVQSVARHYTDWATRLLILQLQYMKMILDQRIQL